MQEETTISYQQLHSLNETTCKLSADIIEAARIIKYKYEDETLSSREKITVEIQKMHKRLSALIDQADLLNIVDEQALRQNIGWMGKNGKIEETNNRIKHFYSPYIYKVTPEGKYKKKEKTTSKVLSHFTQITNHIQNRIHKTFNTANDPARAQALKDNPPYGKDSGFIPAALDW